MYFKSEKELSNKLITALRSKGLKPTTEVPFLGRSIDVAYTCADKTITVIEVKLASNNIRRALNQAKYCLLGSDKVYVCTSPYNMTRRIKAEFKNLGIGLMYLDQKKDKYTVKYAITAGRNKLKMHEYTDKLRRAMYQL